MRIVLEALTCVHHLDAGEPRRDAGGCGNFPVPLGSPRTPPEPHPAATEPTLHFGPFPGGRSWCACGGPAPEVLERDEERGQSRSPKREIAQKPDRIRPPRA